MKVRPLVKPMCEKCKVIKRKGKVMIICENPKHKWDEQQNYLFNLKGHPIYRCKDGYYGHVFMLKKESSFKSEELATTVMASNLRVPMMLTVSCDG